MASSKKLILSLATISCLSSLALAQISGPPYAIPYTQGNNYYYTLLGYYPGTQIEVNGNGSTNSIFLGRYAYVKNGDGSKTIYAYVDNSDKINIPYIINKGIIAGSLNIENKNQTQKDASINVNTIDNQGFLKNAYIGIWGDKQANITINSFSNSGIVYNSQDQAIYLEKNVQITDFTNTGLIAGTTNKLIFGSQNVSSIQIGKDQESLQRSSTTTTIKNFKNQGLIGNSNQDANAIGFNSANLTTFINTQLILSQGKAIHLESTHITNFINRGFIGAYGPYTSGNTSNSSGITILRSTIDNFINTGIISGVIGVNLSGDISTFINTGFIRSTDSTSEQRAAINLFNTDSKAPNIDYLINAGTLDSQSQGILITAGSTINNLFNTGTIKAQKDGITFISENHTQNDIKIGKIILTKDSSIDATQNAINVNLVQSSRNSHNTNLSIDSINIQEGAKVSGGQAGIKIGQSQEVKNSNGTGKDNTVGQIIVAGEVKGGSEGGIVNEGTIKADANGKSRKRRSLDESQQSDEESKAAILIKESGQITSTSGKAGIINKDKGKIEGNIISKSSNTISLENQGSVTGNISNSGTGNLMIENKNNGSSTATISGNIANTGDGSLMLNNSSTLTGNIYNYGSGKLTIENQTNTQNGNTSISGYVANIGMGQLELMNNASISGSAYNIGGGSLMLNNSSTLKSVYNYGSGDLKIENKNSATINSIMNTNSGNVILDNSATITQGITNQGTGNLMITNQSGASIENISNESSGDVMLNNTGSITKGITNSGNGNLNLTNQENATISGGITNSGSGTLMLNNFGSIGTNTDGYNISNEGSGSVNITSWTIRTGSNNKLQTLTVGGKSANSVMVGNLIVDQGNLNMDELNDIKNLVKGVSLNNIKKIKTNGGGEMILNYDALSGKISTDFNLNASIIGASFRSLNASSIKRNAFVDGLMNNMNLSLTFNPNHFNLNTNLTFNEDNLYASINDYIQSDIQTYTHDNIKEHALVILPYFSSQSVELSLNEKSKGHIKGNILAYSTLKESGTYSFYAGYEDTKMNSYYFDVKNRTYYTGIKYFNTLFYTDNNQEVYIKAQAKAAFIKNEFLKKIANNEASANPNAYTYGGGIDLGMNFILGSHMLTPQIGLGYEGSYMQAYSIKDIKGRASVQKGERIYKNINNLFSTKASFAYFKDWLPYLKTSIELGAKLYMNTTIHTKARFGTIKVEDEINLARIQRFANASLILPLNQSFIMSMNYNAQNSKDATTHTAYAQFSYLW
ncbi:hypothetical protein I5Q61_02360 [Campylobacter hepaticus]|uniref:Autotransporter domain-containing protein n=11 Tax=Campylobacter hepaticus TaxID=1813019 RepID=A0AAD0RG18_9BACT|nr:autotransporter outer membrane beta-barrel domain-containing protein [Campylobacter hepaticus]AXP08565.1 hypothetical protein A2J15_002330 [Campylobacter hepaticus]QPM44391.1 hypothetical protein I5Q61_02360 [Campylobacter hepaticus]